MYRSVTKGTVQKCINCQKLSNWSKLPKAQEILKALENCEVAKSVNTLNREST